MSYQGFLETIRISCQDVHGLYSIEMNVMFVNVMFGDGVMAVCNVPFLGEW